MGEFAAYNSAPRVIGLILLSAGFVLMGLWLVGAIGLPLASDRYPAPFRAGIGWLTVAFFGLCGVSLTKRLFDKRPQLQIGPSGVLSRQWSEKLIPWSEIYDVTTSSVERQRCIVLHLHNPSRFPARGVRAVFVGVNRKISGGDIYISLAGTDVRFDDAMAAITRFRR